MLFSSLIFTLFCFILCCYYDFPACAASLIHVIVCTNKTTGRGKGKTGGRASKGRGKRKKAKMDDEDGEDDDEEEDEEDQSGGSHGI